MSHTIALFGGSFDPPHACHVLIAAWARTCADVDEVLVVPAYAHAFGKQSAPFEHRLAMCEAAMAPLEGVVVSDIERRLQKSRTFHTLEALAAERPDARFRLVIGADILESAHRWFRWDDIVKRAPPLLIGREGYASDAALTLPAISSSAIRAAIQNDEGTQSTEGLMPIAVHRYIVEHGLYADDET